MLRVLTLRCVISILFVTNEREESVVIQVSKPVVLFDYNSSLSFACLGLCQALYQTITSVWIL